jgi:hypothetical protein
LGKIPEKFPDFKQIRKICENFPEKSSFGKILQIIPGIIT